MSEIFNITHETGDLSQYTSTVTDGGDLSAAVAAKLIGSYGLSCVVDDTTAIYGEKTFTQLASTAFGYRFYLDPNTLTMANNDLFRVCEIEGNASVKTFVVLQFASSAYKLSVFVVNDSFSNENTGFYTITDEPHWVEVTVTYASSSVASDGTLVLRVDGVVQETKSGLDIFDIAKPDTGRLGATAGLDAGTSGTFYLDDFILRDDGSEIGAGLLLAPSAIKSPANPATINSPALAGAVRTM